MKDILFIDLELNRKGSVVDYGALFGRQELHERSSQKLELWIKEARIVCGHNIIEHDIPELQKVLGENAFEGKKIVDTLLWSSLIFSENPYHHLVKGYKIVNDSEVNNPLSDCKLTQELLLDELNAFNKLDERLKRIYYGLLNERCEYKEFFRLANFSTTPSDLTSDVLALIQGRTCISADLVAMIQLNPVELAYVISIIRLDNNESILPYWVSHKFPRAEQILEKLRFEDCGNPLCEYCSTKLNPKAALSNYFGYPDFRKFEEDRTISLQEETARAGLQDHSFVAVFPTGGGKSLTFQLPALMRGDCTRQLTVIISPLVSLMKDQVDNLEDRFKITKAVSINGLLTPLERKEAIERVESGSAHLLYVSPESLRSPTIYRLISSRTIARFVIDEAHCFSSWGQDFRVDYMYIAEFIKKIQEAKPNRNIPVSCFTATAKPQVIADIEQYFDERLGLRLKQFITRKARTNLSYEVVHVKEPDEKMGYLLPILDQCEKPVIIYASRTKKVEEVSELVGSTGFSCTYFHGQLDREVKKKNMKAFMSGEKEIIVATSAFGMGVDKEDVRTVVHYNISDSLENYIQEAGRAGRKATIQAKCYILFTESDLNKHFSLLQQTKINKKEINEIWRALKQQAKIRPKISKSALEIAKEAGWDTEMKDLETRVKTALSALEERKFLKRQLNSPRVYADSLMVKSYSKGVDIITVSADITVEEKEECKIVLGRIIKDKEARVDYLADRTQLKIRRVQNAIRILRDLKILGDAKDLSAFVNIKRSKNSSRAILEKSIAFEKVLFEILSTKQKHEISLRQLNQLIIDSGAVDGSIEKIHQILSYWEKNSHVAKKRTNREKEVYEIIFKDVEALKEELGWRHELSETTLQLLESLVAVQRKDSDEKEDIKVMFSLLELKESNTFMGQVVEENTRRYESALLFLHYVKSIKLEGGFMVSYTKLNLEDFDEDTRKQFTIDDYEKMETHYQNKTEQIHIVGEYARKSIENYEASLAYVNDYFTLEYEEFLSKYFPNRRRRADLKRPMTPARFKEIVRNLDKDQTTILTDNKSEYTLVLAGPGAGKTMVLVHKIAHLLLMEDIKPEQFLMLTFSKAAALEFRYRVRKLVPEFSGLIKITTFHGFCFELLGQMGDLVKSHSVINQCVDAVEKNELDTTIISNKSVLLLDEVQDINSEEWKLIQTIVQKAENIRVIAVGDDDQNIYSFRGSSNQYMKTFLREYKATPYTLVKNYRSRSGIIEFNNQILSRLSDRIKTKVLVAAKKTRKAKIDLITYRGKYLIQPLAESIQSSKKEGTKAVLVRTNVEALLVRTQLEEFGCKTKLVAGFEGFSLADLVEVRSVTEHLKGNVQESGLIMESDWFDALEKFKSRYSNAPHFQTCLKVLRKFENAYPDAKLLVDWYDFVREVKMEDAINGDSESVIVSTMHKAKGKEFDHVWLLVEDYDFRTNESKRLVYVACSRAKASLEIHTNSKFFDSMSVSELKKSAFEAETAEPNHYELILNHKDINLSSQKYRRAIIEKLKSGESIRKDITRFDDNDAPGLANERGENILLFSRAFLNSKYYHFESKGYNLVKANVEYLVYWYDSNEEKELKVVLPRLRFEKEDFENRDVS